MHTLHTMLTMHTILYYYRGSGRCCRGMRAKVGSRCAQQQQHGLVKKL